MMNSHRSSRARMLGGTAAVVLLAGVTAAFGSAGLAHPHPEGKDGERRQERVIIMEHKGGGHGAHAGADAARHHGEMREFMIRRGPNGEVRGPEGCNDDSRVNVDEQSGDERTRVFVCVHGEGEGNAATRLERLERVRARMAENGELSGEHRQRVLAAIDREIARLRAR